ncbi:MULTISPECIES: hypothetical protein [unclassified Nocardia]|uniref:hypothetical protein n=1 Tax=unclassified Nocardia TaxID=2637762 RepID=UPI001CE43070|nr:MULTISPECIES: hypothetical protein [unclassified Nocardia]
MTDLALTAERRDELATLLGDAQWLRAEYSKVADYLDTACFKGSVIVIRNTNAS